MPLVTSTEMFKKAYDGGYAIGAFNVNNMEIVQGITEACREEKAPVILQVSKGARAYANHTYLVKLVEAAVLECPEIPIVLHLDHGPDFETCKACIDGGFTSVMIDASSKPFAENIEITRKVVEYAHDHGVVVEAELGTLAGIEDDVKVSAEDSSYTHPEEVEEFVSKTGCDSLAIAIGTSHGAYKFKPGTKPQLRFDVLEEVSRRLPGFPIVLHGSSSVPQNYVEMIPQIQQNQISTYQHLQQILSIVESQNIDGSKINNYVVLYDYLETQTDVKTVFENTGKLEGMYNKLAFYQEIRNFFFPVTKEKEENKEEVVEDTQAKVDLKVEIKDAQ